MQESYLINCYNRLNIEFVKGRGVYLWDKDGNKYLDMLGGIAVVGFGHVNKYITKALKSQIKRLWHVSNLYENSLQETVAQKICDRAFTGKVFFCNSGAEANEAAFKFARVWAKKKNKNKIKVASLEGSFHGRTFASLSLTGQEKYRQSFEPLIDVLYLNPNNTKSLKKLNSKFAAVFIEMIQGESGIRPLNEDFVNELADTCKKNDILLIVDEIQTGLGRTGKYFAYQHYNIKPDIITIAKSLGNGLPVGAVLVKSNIAKLIKPGMHATTFGGNYLAMASANATLNLLNTDMLKHINNVSEYLIGALHNIKANYPIIKEIRGKGLMLAIEFNTNIDMLYMDLIKNGIITNKIGNNIIRLLPPLIITKKDIDLFISKLTNLIKSYKNFH